MIHLEIDGRWEPIDFIETLEAIESLYYVALAGTDRSFMDVVGYPFYGYRDPRFGSYNEYVDGTNRWMLDHARRVLPGDRRIYVKRIEFASPGGIDFAGLGKAADAVAHIIDSLIKFFTERHLREEWDKQAAIDTEMKEQSLNALKIDNARKLLELRRDFPDDEHLIALAVRDQDKLVERIAQGQITGSEKRKPSEA